MPVSIPRAHWQESWPIREERQTFNANQINPHRRRVGLKAVVVHLIGVSTPTDTLVLCMDSFEVAQWVLYDSLVAKGVGKVVPEIQL